MFVFYSLSFIMVSFPFYYVAQDYFDNITTPHNNVSHHCGAWWLIGRFITFHLGFESRSGCPVGTLGKSFTRSCLWCFGMKLRHSIRVVWGLPLSSNGLEEAL